MFNFHLKLHYLKNAQYLFSCRPCDSLAELALRPRLFGFQPAGITFNGSSFGLPFPVPLRFPFRDSLPRFPFGFPFGEAASSRETYQSFNQQTPGVLSALAGSLLRGMISCKNIPELTNHFIFDLLLQHWKEHSELFGCPGNIGLLLVGPNSDPSVARILRPDRFGFQFS